MANLRPATSKGRSGGGRELRSGFEAQVQGLPYRLGIGRTVNLYAAEAWYTRYYVFHESEITAEGWAGVAVGEGRSGQYVPKLFYSGWRQREDKNVPS